LGGGASEVQTEATEKRPSVDNSKGDGPFREAPRKGGQEGKKGRSPQQVVGRIYHFQNSEVPTILVGKGSGKEPFSIKEAHQLVTAGRMALLHRRKRGGGSDREWERLSLGPRV